MGRRRFAKNSEDVRHFRLVARSQNDPRGDNAGATPLVLEPFAPPGVTKRCGHSKDEMLEIPKTLEDALGPAMFGHEVPIDDGDSDLDEKSDGEKDKDIDDLDDDCYFPKDGYNYDQHLKRCAGGKGGGVGGIVMDAPKPKEGAAPPITAKDLAVQQPTNAEEAAVLRSLEFAEEYEELADGDLEDIFPGGLAQPEEVILFGPGAADNDLPDLAFFQEMKKMQAARAEAEARDAEDGEEGGQEGEGAADFDEFLAEEYGKEDIGACSDDEIEGELTLDKCEELLDEYIQDKKEEVQQLYSINEPQKGIRDDVPRVIEETKAIIAKHYSETPEDEKDTSSGEESEDESKTWDCETVLSTLSNLSNRPGKIGRIKVLKKPAHALKPVTEDGKEEEEDKEGDSEEDNVVELPDVITTRQRGETPEERKARKASVKEMRRVCRKMKKESKEMYKAEAQKLPGHQATADVRAKLRTFKL
mmetsp:Transcript_10225/g.23050  ORF Transcript_10225/g.23050 Transcript_10225/m.23050 type:complete len:474 (-) Transcript_10225:222-1643(-)